MKGRNPAVRNPIGEVIAERRTVLGLARSALPHPTRIERLERTARIKQAEHLISMEGSNEFLDALALDRDELIAVLHGDLSIAEALERAEQRAGPAENLAS